MPSGLEIYDANGVQKFNSNTDRVLNFIGTSTESFSGPVSQYLTVFTRTKAGITKDRHIIRPISVRKDASSTGNWQIDTVMYVPQNGSIDFLVHLFGWNNFDSTQKLIIDYAIYRV